MEEKEKTSEAPETQETTATTTKAVRLKNQTSRIYTLFVAVFVLLIAAGMINDISIVNRQYHNVDIVQADVIGVFSETDNDVVMYQYLYDETKYISATTQEKGKLRIGDKVQVCISADRPSHVLQYNNKSTAIAAAIIGNMEITDFIWLMLIIWIFWKIKDKSVFVCVTDAEDVEKHKCD